MNVATQGHGGTNLVAVQIVPENWKWFLTLGIILILVGGFAIIFPLGASVGMEIFIGIILLISGCAYLVHAFAAHEQGFFWQLLLAILYLATGILLLVYPLSGVVTLTLILGIGFLAAGLFRAVVAIGSRSTNGWSMLLINGLLGAVIGLLILTNWPTSSEWAIGVLVGIDLLFSGMTMTMLALATRNS